MQRILALLVLCASMLALSCRKESPAPYPVLTEKPVCVVCEGAYGSGNSALTVYYPDTAIAIEDAYYKANNHSLGDVFQSMLRTSQDFYFLSVNNSDRINVISTGNLQDLGTISIPKPRYAVQVSNTKVYVSTMFSNKIYIINPGSMSVTGIITMPFKNPEGMALVDNKVWVATWDTAAAGIYAIDTSTDAIGAPVAIGAKAPQEVLQDAEGMLWVLSGNNAQGTPSYLTRINPATGGLLKQYAFGIAEPIRPVLNRTKDTLYFIEVAYNGGSSNNGVYRMGIHDAALPAQPFVEAKGLQYFWGVGIHPESGNVYIADPKGFTQRGAVSIYQPDGTLVDSFSTGIGPGHFYFQ